MDDARGWRGRADRRAKAAPKAKLRLVLSTVERINDFLLETPLRTFRRGVFVCVGAGVLPAYSKRLRADTPKAFASRRCLHTVLKSTLGRRHCTLALCCAFTCGYCSIFWRSCSARSGQSLAAGFNIALSVHPSLAQARHTRQLRFETGYGLPATLC